MGCTCFVIGSKPEVYFPEDSPCVVVGVNGALSRAHEISKKHGSEVFWVVSEHVFREKFKKTLSEVTGCSCKKAMLIPASSGRCPGATDIYASRVDADEVRVISRRYRELVLVRALGFVKFTRLMVKVYGVVSTAKRLFRYSILLDESRLLKVSNGVFALALFLSQSRKLVDVNIDKFVLVGCGINSGSAHWYDKDHLYGVSHTLEDFVYMKALIEKYGSRMISVSDIEFASAVQSNSPLGGG